MSKEILTKLNPKTVNFLGSGGCGGGLSPADVSACLSGASRLGVATLLASIGGDTRVHKKDFDNMFDGILGLAKENHWVLKNKGKRLKILLQLAIHEHCNRTACPTCKGSKYHQSDKTKLCRTCRGVGIYMSRQQEKAELIEVTQQAWSRMWDLRYTQIHQYIQENEHKAMREIHKKLSQDD